MNDVIDIGHERSLLIRPGYVISKFVGVVIAGKNMVYTVNDRTRL
jgi:hypothetical protein